MSKIRSAFGEREVLRVCVLRFEVEVEIAVDAEVQRVKVPEGIAKDETLRKQRRVLTRTSRLDSPIQGACCALAAGTRDTERPDSLRLARQWGRHQPPDRR